MSAEGPALAELFEEEIYLDLRWLPQAAPGRTRFETRRGGRGFPSVPAREYWVAKRGRELFGLIVLDPELRFEGAVQACELPVAVPPRRRRQGVGQLLLDFAEERAAAEAWDRLYAIIDESNRAGRRLFEAGGYVEGGSAPEGHLRYSKDELGVEE